jgi:hypothetical protein
MADLLTLVRDPAVDIAAIAAHLDALPLADRQREAHALGRADQRQLWHKAAAAPALTLDDFVPASVPPLTPVRHEGRNTLPLPGKHKFFAKPMVRPADGSARLFGYNDAPSRGLVGPGYFVAHDTASEPAWQERGAIVVDYFLVPDGPVAEGWPAVKENHQGLQRLVYYHTRDFMRRVADGVTIGAAYKEDKALDHYFVLVRQ